MRCELRADVQVHRFVVIAEMAYLEKRPELAALCRAARNAGRRIDEPLISRILPGVMEAGARNILAYCHNLGLCDGQGVLRALGEQVATDALAPVPEQGVYELWVADHPLLGKRILHVERLRPEKDPRLVASVPLPVTPQRDTRFVSIIRPNDVFVLRALPTERGTALCMPVPDRSVCHVRWTLDFLGEREQLQVEGQLDVAGELREILPRPERAGLDVAMLRDDFAWKYLQDHGQWNAQTRRLSIRFDRLPEVEQDTFKKSYAIGTVSIANKGLYNNVTLKDVPIGPISGSDAQVWALARLHRALARRPAYLTRRELRSLFADLVEETPLEDFRPRLPAHEELIRERSGEPSALFRLATPVDLSPIPVDKNDLDPFSLEAPEDAHLPSDTQVVRVRYRSRLAMHELVGRLLVRTRPRRVLLCDKYVRTREQLANLGLLLASLREHAPETKLQVVTGSNESRLSEEISKITGAAPEHYDRVFGSRAHPHARYLVIDAGRDGLFGWQMDNSPLDARVLPGPPPEPRTPLLFRDFGAFRVERDGLPEGLCRWLEGGAR